MRKIGGIFLLSLIITMMLSVAAIPAMIWLDNWFTVLTCVLLFFGLIGVQAFYFGNIMNKILDKLIKDANSQPK